MSSQKLPTLLSDSLRPIVELELELGNVIEEVQAIGQCPILVLFGSRMHFAAIEQRLTVPAHVQRWECRDPHYPKQSGYECQQTRNVLAGPI